MQSANDRHRPELAWIGTETNEFGTDEFMKWCEVVGTEPYLCLNFGTGTLAEGKSHFQRLWHQLLMHTVKPLDGLNIATLIAILTMQTSVVRTGAKSLTMYAKFEFNHVARSRTNSHRRSSTGRLVMNAGALGRSSK